MKDKKKITPSMLKKHLGKDFIYETQAIALAMKIMDGACNDGWGVIYSKGGKRLIAAAKALEGTYTVKEGTAEVCDNAFWGCPFLHAVEMPSTIKRIGNEAFARCLSLESVNIPVSVEEIGTNPFVSIDSKAIKNESEAFVIDAKILYNADRTRLISCLTDAAMVIIPKVTQTIGSLAFACRNKLKKIQLPDGLSCIERSAFFGCNALEEITIPASVTEVAPYAFAGCDSLKKVTFTGTPKHLARTAFSDCRNLMSITIPEGAEETFGEMLHLAPDSDTLALVTPANEK